jgi:hypothetical protein
MKPRTSKRVQRVEQLIAARPIRADVLDHAFEHFCATGELPEEQRLAREVCDRALLYKPVREPIVDIGAHLEDLKRILAELRSRPDLDLSAPQHDHSVRLRVFNEAVYGHEIVRTAARAVIRITVRNGADVTDPQFLAEHSLPEYSSVALHLLGFPENLAKPPYVRQAKRLFARIASFRSRLDHGSRSRLEEFDAAFPAFVRTGELPEDDLVLECVLVVAALLVLMAHYLGHGDAELTAALDATAKTRGGMRAAAVAKVQELVRAGRLSALAE